MNNKRVVITGGSSGMGRAAVKKFLENGCLVIFADRNEDLAQEVIGSHQHESDNGRLHFYCADISREEEIIKLVKYTNETIGGCDVLINNAGIFKGGKIHEIASEDWDMIFAVNVKAIYLASKYFVPAMLQRGYGTIINTASVSGLFGDYDAVAYNASKGAVINMTQAMALDYADKGIRVNAVCPGATATPMFLGSPPEVIKAFENAFPMKRLAQPEDIANAMYFLASDQASFITGTIIKVDGGMTAHTGQPKQ